MADVLIRGMEMPKYTTRAEFGIDADGNPLCMVYYDDGNEPDIYDVVPLPEGHRRLIDAERFRVILCRLKERQIDDVAIHALNWAIECLDKLESVVDAEGENE